MALPANYDSMRADSASERTDDVDTYKVTCMDFIRDISADYLAWVDFYKLPQGEDKKRRAEIAATIEKTNTWIAKVAQSIKAVDVVMNDGIQKMAEATAGRPFQLGVFVNRQSGYTVAKGGAITATVRASGRQGRLTRLGYHFKRDRFRIESTCGATIDEEGLPEGDYAELEIPLTVNAGAGRPLDVISFTVTIVELEGGLEHDKRGVSTIIHLA